MTEQPIKKTDPEWLTLAGFIIVPLFLLQTLNFSASGITVKVIWALLWIILTLAVGRLLIKSASLLRTKLSRSDR